MNVTPLYAAQYARILEAMVFYKQKGAIEVAVPWVVEPEYLNITSPHKHEVPAMVGSAEQSFLQMAHHGLLEKGILYVGMSPCVRQEPILDELHHNYFLKVEQFYLPTDGEGRGRSSAIQAMLRLAEEFFSRHIRNRLEYSADCVDIVSYEHGIELGSYGFRSTPEIGHWVYGTGCAEPRLTTAIAMESAGLQSKGKDEE